MTKFEITGRLEHTRLFDPRLGEGLSGKYGCVLYSFRGFKGLNRDFMTITEKTRPVECQDGEVHEGIVFKSAIRPAVIGLPKGFREWAAERNTRVDLWLNSLEVTIIGSVYEIAQRAGTKRMPGTSEWTQKLLAPCAVRLLEQPIIPSDAQFWEMCRAEDTALARHHWARDGEVKS